MRYYFYTFFLLFLFIDILFFSIDVFSIDILYQQSLPSYRSGWQFFCVLQHKNAVFHINSHISSSFLLKNKISKCNSTLPPRCCYRYDNQWIIRGGITGGIRVELHVIPP